MRKKKTEKFTVKLTNGQEVEVTWTKIYFPSGDMDHLEFRGPISETGYRSHFIQKHSHADADREKVLEYAGELAQKWWKENEYKYGKQMSLPV